MIFKIKSWNVKDCNDVTFIFLIREKNMRKFENIFDEQKKKQKLQHIIFFMYSI